MVIVYADNVNGCVRVKSLDDAPKDGEFVDGESFISSLDDLKNGEIIISELSEAQARIVSIDYGINGANSNITKDNLSYIGDGVYITFDGYGYILRANHHEEDQCSDQIYIEPCVLRKLINFDKAMKSKYGVKE